MPGVLLLYTLVTISWRIQPLPQRAWQEPRSALEPGRLRLAEEAGALTERRAAKFGSLNFLSFVGGDKGLGEVGFVTLAYKIITGKSPR
jgi:hypothetical protein